jgi:hypothetical protein
MRITRAIILLVTLVAGTNLASGAPSETQPQRELTKPGPVTTNGRFQIFQGSHTIFAKETIFKDTGIFKIDTETGRTWKYTEGQTKEGQVYMRWDPVDQ